MKLAKTLRKISSISLVGTLAAGVLAGALNFDAWKSNLPAEVAQYKIVLGSNARATDVLGAVELAAALQYYAKTTEPTSGTVTIEKTGTVYEGAIDLYKDANKLVLGDDLSDAVKVISDGLVFGSGTFKDKDNNEYTYTQEIDFDEGTATDDVEIHFKDKPDTDDDDPALMIYGGNDYFYYLRVTFNSPIDANKVKAKPIELFGKKYYFDEVTSSKWVLREAADEVTLDVGESIEFEGKNVKLVDVVKSGTTYYAQVEVDGEKKTIQVGDSEEVNGVDIYVTGAWVSETQEGKGYAELIIGGKLVELVKDSYVKVGGDELRNVEVVKADTSGLTLKVRVSDDANKNYVTAGSEFVDPLFGTFKIVFAPVDLKADKQLIELRDAGDTKLDVSVTDHRGYTKTITLYEYDNTGTSTGVRLLGSDGTDSGQKWVGEVVSAGTSATTSEVEGVGNAVIDTDTSDVDATFYVLTAGKIHKIDVYAVDNASSPSQLTIAVDGGSTETISLSSNTGTKTLDGVTVTFTVTPDGGDADSDLDALTVDRALDVSDPTGGTDTGKALIDVQTNYYVTIVESGDKASYLLRFRSWDKSDNEVEFEDVFSGQTITGTYSDTTNIGKITIAGKDYYFIVDESNNKIRFPDSGNADLTLYLKDEAKLTVGTGVGDGDGMDIEIVEHSTDTAADKLVVDVDWSSSKLSLSGVTYADRASDTEPEVMDSESVSTSGDYEALTDWGTYLEYKTGDEYYFKAYVPDEQAWYDIKLAPAEAKEVTETKTLEEGDKIPGTEWVIKQVTSGERVVLTPLTGLAVLDTNVEPADTRLIVIGGPAVNALVQNYVNAGLVTVPDSGAVVKLIEEDGKIVVVVAGANDVSTAKATAALARYLLTGDYSEKFEGTDEVVFTPEDIQGVTFAAVEGVTPTSETEFQPPEEQPPEEEQPAPGEVPSGEEPEQPEQPEQPTTPEQPPTPEQPAAPGVNLWLIAGVVAVAAILGAVYFLKFRK